MSIDGSVAVFVRLGYWDAYRTAVVLTARPFRKVLWILGVIGTLLLVVLGLAWLHPKPEVDWQQIGQNCSPLLLVILLPILFTYVLPLLSARRALNDERLKQGISYQFSQSGIHVESCVAKAELQWAAIRHAIETRTAFLLLPTSNLAHTVPLRCFAGESDIQTARELFRTKIPTAKLRA